MVEKCTQVRESRRMNIRRNSPILVAVTFVALHFFHFLDRFLMRLITFIGTLHRMLINIIHVIVTHWALRHVPHPLSDIINFMTMRLT